MTTLPAFANTLPPNLAILEKEPADLKIIEKLVDYRWFDQALKALINYPDTDEKALFLKARCWMGLKSYKEALELFHQLAESSSSFEMRREALLKEAMIFVRLKKYEAALDIYNRLLEENRGKKRGIREIAKRAFKTALEAKKYDEGLLFLGHFSGDEARWWRGWCHFRKEEYDAALTYWDKISKRSDFYPQTLFWKSQIFKKIKNPEKSDSCFQTLLQEYPFHYYSFLALFEKIPRKKDRLDLISTHWSGDRDKSKWMERYPRTFEIEVKKAAKKRDLDSYFVFAVIWQESHFREWVVSPSGAIGLMQLMPQTALTLAHAIQLRHFDLVQILKPEMNIKLGSLYLSFLKKLFSGHLPLAVAAYNAGEEAVSRWLSLRKKDSLPLIIEEIPYDETQKYTKKVLLAHWIYHWLYRGDVPPVF